MTFREKLQITINQRYPTENLQKHSEDYFCNKWWCHLVKIDILTLSEIKSDLNSVQFQPQHKQIELDILERGFDYKISHIYLTSKNAIIDGHHRFFILKKHFDDSLQLKVYKLLHVNNRYIMVIKLLFFQILIQIGRLFLKKEKGRIIELDL